MEKIRLEDVEIEILVRSGKTDLSTLIKLQQVFKTSGTSELGDVIVLTEVDNTSRSNSSGNLSTTKYKYYIK